QRQQLVLVLGRFVSAGDPDAIRRGTQTLFDTVQGKVLYSTSSDFQPPQMANLRISRVVDDPSSPTSATIGFSLDATDAGGTVKQIVAVYRSGTVWRTAYLTQVAGTSRWTGGGPGSATDAPLDHYL